MKVWIVEYDDGDYSNFTGVYSTKQKAYEAILICLKRALDEAINSEAHNLYKNDRQRFFNNAIEELNETYAMRTNEFNGGSFWAYCQEIDQMP